MKVRLTIPLLFLLEELLMEQEHWRRLADLVGRLKIIPPFRLIPTLPYLRFLMARRVRYLGWKMTAISALVLAPSARVSNSPSRERVYSKAAFMFKPRRQPPPSLPLQHWKSEVMAELTI